MISFLTNDFIRKLKGHVWKVFSVSRILGNVHLYQCTGSTNSCVQKVGTSWLHESSASLLCHS